MRFNPELPPESAQDLIEGLARNGREAAIVRESGQLSVDAAAFLDEPLSYLLDGIDMGDRQSLSKTVKALNKWGEQEAVPVTARTALALSAHGLARIHNISFGAASCLGTYIKRYSALDMPKLPEPEFAAYFTQSLRQIPAHTVVTGRTDSVVHLYPGLTMADTIHPSPKGKGPLFMSDAELVARDYVRGYRRRFALSQLVYGYLANEA